MSGSGWDKVSGIYTLRVTQVYRRKDGEWKVVHRHGDQLPIDRSQPLPGEHRPSRSLLARGCVPAGGGGEEAASKVEEVDIW
jgi:hypothetical protein